MPEEVIQLKSEKSKYILSLISSLIFALLTLKVMILTGHYIIIFALIFFGIASIASVIPLLPNQSYIKIDKPGITIRSMFKTINITWHEVERFYTEKRNNKEIVVFSFFERKKTYLNIENLTGKKEVLPDNYGMKAKDLTILLEYYRVRNIFS